MEDAGRRVSRYLTRNFSQHLFRDLCCCWVASHRSSNAALWGVLAAVLRFIPTSVRGWRSLAVILFVCDLEQLVHPAHDDRLFIVLEAIVSNFVEPWLYGANTGVSPML